MNKYVTELNNDDVLDLGSALLRHGPVTILYNKIENNQLKLEFKTKNKRRVDALVSSFKCSAVLDDFEIKGRVNDVYPIDIDKYFMRYITFMIDKFGVQYAGDFYNYHKAKIEEIKDITGNNLNKAEVSAEMIRKEAANMLKNELKQLQILKGVVNAKISSITSE